MNNSGWVPVSFSREEQREIQQIGAARRGVKEVRGMSGDKLEARHQMGYDGMILAYAAERALCRFLGVEPQRDVGMRGNKGVHAALDGLTFNSSYISDPSYGMKFDYERVPPTDVFILASGGIEAMWLVGGISRASFLDMAQERDFGYGPRLFVEQQRLAPISEIAAFLDLSGSIERLRESERKKRVQEQNNLGYMFGDDPSEHIDVG